MSSYCSASATSEEAGHSVPSRSHFHFHQNHWHHLPTHCSGWLTRCSWWAPSLKTQHPISGNVQIRQEFIRILWLKPFWLKPRSNPRGQVAGPSHDASVVPWLVTLPPHLSGFLRLTASGCTLIPTGSGLFRVWFSCFVNFCLFLTWKSGLSCLLFELHEILRRNFTWIGSSCCYHTLF